ncbi:MAG: alpha/beta hydrolase [Planctomycetota bacterium]|jgi:pimeloyl-ACP methyl ester carboxylesterase
MKRPLLVVLLAVVAALCGPALAADSEVVTFKTEDRLQIQGDLFAAGVKGAPGVVALHMYPADRKSWGPVARDLKKAGIDFLAIDMRGYGGSRMQGRKDLGPKVKERDAGLFRAMHKDALAAYRFLVERGTDPDRVAFLGASVGCSVSIDATAREPRIRGACVMTPGKNYLGVPTMQHLSDYGKRPLLILSSKEEAAVGAQPIKDALGDTAELVLCEQKGVHGTRMFGKVPGVEERIVKWFVSLLGAPAALDGRVSDDEMSGGDFGTWDLRADGNSSIFLKPVGSYLYVALKLEKAAAAPESFYFAFAPDGKLEGARRVACAFDKRGGKFTLEAMKGGAWKPAKPGLRKGARLGVSKSTAIELLLPMADVGLAKGRDYKVTLGFRRKASDILRAIPQGDQTMEKVDEWLPLSLR